VTMTGGALALLLAGSPDKDTSRAPTDDDPGVAARPRRADARPPNSNSCTVPTATIRHALRALASESGPGERLNQVRSLRPVVALAAVVSGDQNQDLMTGQAAIPAAIADMTATVRTMP
jgi:hypothetical protein